MSVLDKPKKEHEWLLVFGTEKIRKGTSSQARTTALTKLKPLVLLAQKSYQADATALVELRKELEDLKLVGGVWERKFKVGPASGTVRIERI